jgi:hypothetical protein
MSSMTAATLTSSRQGVGPDGHVAAGDVVADRRRRDQPLVADDAADRHRVTEMVVRAEHRGAPSSPPGTLDLRAHVVVDRSEHFQHGEILAFLRVTRAVV